MSKILSLSISLRLLGLHKYFYLKLAFLYFCLFFVRLDGVSPAILRVPLVGANILFSPLDS
ncbi:hypothetical protein Sps_03251 [Shewanella psychrophila]|uniref:Uncharacterized protein n=1 Tax=Shewanella psychrophila TaxID=225848 RepID=A0A1S6HS92_9GAMM|nr:hypothetical protein Sps_03251 [Shewanella psychrophila]